MNPIVHQKNHDATIYIGNLDSRVHEDLLWELFLQTGPVVYVNIPRDKISGEHQGYGFVEFRDEDDAEYAIKIMHTIQVYGKPIKVSRASNHTAKQTDVGANLFVGNLDLSVSEKVLTDAFTSFGNIVNVRVERDNVSGTSKRFAFINYDNFESSDAAIQAMNGQFIGNRPLRVTYAYKNNSRRDRHGTMAERLLASNKPSKKPYVISAAFSQSSQVSQEYVIDQPPPLPSQPPPAPPTNTN